MPCDSLWLLVTAHMAQIVEVRRAESLTEVTQARHNKFDLGIA